MSSDNIPDNSNGQWPMELDEYARYGRQMIMPDFGLPGQLKLKRTRVAVVGAGGLGCPLLQYIVGAGIGEVSIFDHDEVSVSNLHRQVLHTTERVGMNKALSACIALKSLNPHSSLVPRPEPVMPDTALEQLGGHDVIVDCTDRPSTRYLISDASVRLGIPLVSGAAISGAGQWAVYGGRVGDGEGAARRACYRCLWPKVLPGGSATCDEQGVWGVVTGIVGCAMASEVLKLVVGRHDPEPLLHFFHLGGNPLVRTIRMRPPSVKCIACGPNATVTDDLSAVGYDAFCGVMPVVDDETGQRVGNAGERIGVDVFSKLLRSTSSEPTTVVIDTRPPGEYTICALPGTTNIPLKTILSAPETVPESPHLVLLCRRGNDSQIAAAHLRAKRPGVSVVDVQGGLTAWSRHIDPAFPVY